MSNPFLRYGITSGACCAAAAKAAALAVTAGTRVDRVGIPTPIGVRLEVLVSSTRTLGVDAAEATVVKDAGDNPDVTNGVEFVARVRLTKGTSITVKGGKGVGVAAKQGLPIPVGSRAINPVPRKMIEDAVREVLGEQGAEVEIAVPKGEAIASKTLNSRLGIVDGISILGTTGVEEPVSTEEYLGHLKFQIDKAACVTKTLVLTPGNSGLALARKMFDLPEESFVLVGDKIGEAIDHSVTRGIQEMVLFGLPGKLVKVAAGVFNTHSRVADARLETIAAVAAAHGAAPELARKILDANTVETAVALLDKDGLTAEVFDEIATRIGLKTTERVAGKLKAGAAIISQGGRMLGIDEKVLRMKSWKGRPRERVRKKTKGRKT